MNIKKFNLDETTEDGLFFMAKDYYWDDFLLWYCPCPSPPEAALLIPLYTVLHCAVLLWFRYCQPLLFFCFISQQWSDAPTVIGMALMLVISIALIQSAFFVGGICEWMKILGRNTWYLVQPYEVLLRISYEETELWGVVKDLLGINKRDVCAGFSYIVQLDLIQ